MLSVEQDSKQINNKETEKNDIQNHNIIFTLGAVSRIVSKQNCIQSIIKKHKFKELVSKKWLCSLQIMKVGLFPHMNVLVVVKYAHFKALGYLLATF